MNGRKGENLDEQGVRFVPSTGIVIAVIHKEKTARITDAMTDLQLGIDSLGIRLPSVGDGNQSADSLSSFARICSVSLRKTMTTATGAKPDCWMIASRNWSVHSSPSALTRFRTVELNLGRASHF